MATARHHRHDKTPPAAFAATLDSFRLHLNAEGLSPKTVRLYADAAAWLAAEGLTHRKDWSEVTKADVNAWTVRLLDRYSATYANNQWRALQQFFRWFSAEEESPNPMAGLKPPKVVDKPVDVFTADEYDRLLKACAGRGFLERRDHAIVALLRDTGIRLAELSRLELGDVSLLDREAVVTGKGRKTRTVKFLPDTARSLDRYLRERAKRPGADGNSRLWIGATGRGSLTEAGVYQAVKRRGRQADVEVWPHKFRHDFSHRWLDQGGPEGDLMELNGWESRSMLRRYGRSAASARARRSYDRIMGASDDRRAS